MRLQGYLELHGAGRVHVVVMQAKRSDARRAPATVTAPVRDIRARSCVSPVTEAMSMIAPVALPPLFELSIVVFAPRLAAPRSICCPRFGSCPPPRLAGARHSKSSGKRQDVGILVSQRHEAGIQEVRVDIDRRRRSGECRRVGAGDWPALKLAFPLTVITPVCEHFPG